MGSTDMEPYRPPTLPLKQLDYSQLLTLVGEANAELARYDGLLQGIVNSSVMLSPLTNQEAVLSSRIEGTQATVPQLLEQEAGMAKEGEILKDIQEITNYRQALHDAYDYLRERPITLSFIRKLHKILMNSVRGRDKTPGQFRTDQNWIGSHGSPIEEATFVLPSPLQLIDHLEAWQKYLNSNDKDPLLQSAVMHAQFELIHPFKDGNGRIGRILIPLFLYQKEKLSQPMFYLSAYLEAHREEYYSALQNISQHSDWNGWIIFFLKAIGIQAKTNNNKVQSILKLYNDMKQKIQNITHSQYTVYLLDAIFDRPIFRITDLLKKTNIHRPTAMSLLRQLKGANILTELMPPRGRRAAVLCFPDLLNITEGIKVF